MLLVLSVIPLPPDKGMEEGFFLIYATTMLPDRLTVDNAEFFAEVRRQLAADRSVTIRARGSSMLPFIRDGRDCVVLRRRADTAVGDIVLAALPDGSHVLHRVYAVHGDTLVLMGDGNLQATERCRRSDVLATVTHIERDGRRVDCMSPTARRRAAVWRWLLPLRRCLLAAMRLSARLKVKRH